MKNLILGLVFSVMSVIANAEIQVQLEASSIAVNEPFKLSLIQDNPQNQGVPDLTVLRGEFIILGTERNVSYSVINGQAHASSQWIVALKAKKEGVLTIPSIKIGLERSMPMTINVTQAASENSNASNHNTEPSQDIFLTTAVNSSTVYVNQQITLNVKLFRSTDVQLLNANYRDPQVEDALLIPLGDVKRYQTAQNNAQYFVEEQNYAIFPQKSGILEIHSPIFTALVYDFVPQRLKAQDKTKSIRVEPAPSQFSGRLWLPAKNIKLTERYEDTSQALSQGSTITRTVTIEGVGIPAQLLPSLDFKDSKDFSVYPEKGAVHNHVNQGEIVGSTEIKATYLFNNAGNITIPELKLPWFDTVTRREAYATLPPRSFKISALATDKAISKKSNSENNNTVTKPTKTKSIRPSSEYYWGWLVALILGVIWVITLGFLGWRKHSATSNKKKQRRIIKQLEKACVRGHPEAARDALLHWASLQWPDARFMNLTDLVHAIHDKDFKQQVHLLSQALYKHEDKTIWKGDTLFRLVQSIRKRSLKTKPKAPILPPINRL